MPEVLRIAREQFDGLGHRVVGCPEGCLTGKTAARGSRKAVALRQHEVGNTVLGIQIAGLTCSGGSLGDVVGGETHQTDTCQGF